MISRRPGRGIAILFRSQIRARQPSSTKAEANLHFASSETCNAESPTIKILPHPSPFQGKFQDGCPQRSADMRAPLAPIQACTSKPAYCVR